MRLLITALIALFLVNNAGANDYPSKEIRIVVPFPPGNSVDTFARFISERLAKNWNVAVIVDNKPGAGSTLGTAAVASAEPDGYTILLNAATIAINAAVRDDLSFDLEKDLTPVAIIAEGNSLLVASSRVKSNTLAEFLDEAKGREIYLATSGVGSHNHVTGELLAEAGQFKVKPVHYKGSTEAIVDLVGARVDIFVNSVSSIISHVENGGVKALAVIGRERLEALPDVPTTAESGISAEIPKLWWGIFAPSATPDEIVRKLHGEVNSIMATQEAKDSWSSSRLFRPR